MAWIAAIAVATAIVEPCEELDHGRVGTRVPREEEAILTHALPMAAAVDAAVVESEMPLDTQSQVVGQGHGSSRVLSLARPKR